MPEISFCKVQKKYLDKLQEDKWLCEKFGPVTWDEKFEHFVRQKFIIPVLTAKDIVFIKLRRLSNGTGKE